jgi:hypothetical protein
MAAAACLPQPAQEPAASVPAEVAGAQLLLPCVGSEAQQ